MVFSMISQGLESFASANSEAGQIISQAGAVDHAAMMAAATAALGPFAGGYLSAYGPAQAAHLAATASLGQLHTQIAQATVASEQAFLTADGQ